MIMDNLFPGKDKAIQNKKKAENLNRLYTLLKPVADIFNLSISKKRGLDSVRLHNGQSDIYIHAIDDNHFECRIEDDALRAEISDTIGAQAMPLTNSHAPQILRLDRGQTVSAVRAFGETPLRYAPHKNDSTAEHALH